MSTTLEKLNRVYGRLQDDESRFLFDARLSYVLNGDTKAFFAAVGNLYKDWCSPKLEAQLAALGTQDIVIVGSGYNARITKELLSYWGYSIVCFCETIWVGNAEGRKEAVDGIKVLSLSDALDQYGTALFVIGSSDYRDEMMCALKKNGLFDDQILIPRYKYLIAVRGKQYFDLFEPEDNEVYVDAGTFDGGSVRNFFDWAGEKGKKVFAIEPLADMESVIREKFDTNELEKIKIVNGAAWNTHEELSFSIHGAGSSIGESGDVTVKGVDIDSLVGKEKVTFIKMDIEGSELQALQGAQNTITRDKPRLAICVYHKGDDIPELGNYILELVPDYKLYLRHYASNRWETVLYATL